MMDEYHVIVRSCKNNEIIDDFRITCKIGYLIEYVRKRLIDFGYTYYNISKNLYIEAYINESNGVGSNKITSMI